MTMEKQKKESPAPVQARKSGYLESHFRLFYNTDRKKRSFPLHYHDFHKIMLFLEGNVSYLAEGRQYDLKPGDIVLIPAGAIHAPDVHDDTPYERVIIYISPDFFLSTGQEADGLSVCFDMAQKQGFNLIRPEGAYRTWTFRLSEELSHAAADKSFGAERYRRIKTEELLIVCGRILLEREEAFAQETSSNPLILSVMKYLNTHLKDEDLTIDDIAEYAALHRSYLMHLFKAEVGCSVGSYITEKRLFLAKNLLRDGYSVTDACFESGFKNYSAFYYAYKKKYGVSPSGQESLRHVEGE